MAARKKPAGIRSVVYGIGKGKVRIEGLSVKACPCKRYLVSTTIHTPGPAEAADFLNAAFRLPS
jgi:hypothetical protein